MTSCLPSAANSLSTRFLFLHLFTICAHPAGPKISHSSVCVSAFIICEYYVIRLLCNCSLPGHWKFAIYA